MPGRLRTELLQNRPFASTETEAVLNLIRTAEVMRHQCQALMRAEGLTESGYNILRILRGAGPAGWCCGEIAQRMLVVDPDITRLIDRLVKLGLVDRQRTEADRRIVQVVLTPAGLALCNRLDAPLVDLHRRLVGHLGTTRLEQLIELLERIRAHPGASTAIPQEAP
jgi:DNA-binding MarR family transcriptional regulator